MSCTYLDELHAKLTNEFEKFDELSDMIKESNNVFSHVVTVERLVLDESWVNAIDTALRSVEIIIRAPKKSIKDDSLIVPVEKANKVTKESITHLANHSENIKYANAREIMPNKVLTSIVEENLAIYENRFIVTLINKLARFVDERYKVIKKIIRVTCHDCLNLESSFKMGRSRVKCKMTFDIKDLPEDDSNKKNAEVLTKVDNIKRRISLIKKSGFFVSLKGAKPVFAPIVKTNILTKNVDYNNAYRLWVFMAGYAEEGFSLEVTHKQLPCDQEYCDDLVNVLSVLTATGVANHNIRREEFNSLPLKKVIDRKYRIVSRLNYKPTFGRAPKQVGEEVVNEYFYRSMQNKLSKGTGVNAVKSGGILQERNIAMPFGKFYRAVTRVSNNMYKEVLDVKYKTLRKVNPTKNDELRLEKDRQKEIIRRTKILVSLKEEEYLSQLKQLSREELKLKKIHLEKVGSDVKKLDKQAAEYMRRNSSRKIKQREDRILQRAERYKAQLFQKDEERRLAKEAEEKAQQVSIRREERERKLLALLKQKYES